MARQMWVEATAVFRAVVTVTGEGRNPQTRYYGPFSTKGQATAAITRAKTAVRRRYSEWNWETNRREHPDNHTVDAHVETTGLNWTPVP